MSKNELKLGDRVTITWTELTGTIIDIDPLGLPGFCRIECDTLIPAAYSYPASYTGIFMVKDIERVDHENRD